MQGAINEAAAANTKLFVIGKLDHSKTDQTNLRAICEYSKHKLSQALLRQVNIDNKAVAPWPDALRAAKIMEKYQLLIASLAARVGFGARTVTLSPRPC